MAGALVMALAVAGIASAVNTYQVHLADSQARSSGSPARPAPAQLRVGYRVGDTENLRPQVVGEYRIAAEGLKAFPDARPTCTFEQAAGLDIAAACRKAIVGGGTIENEAGAPNDRTQKLPCNVKLTLINIRTGDARDPKTLRAVRRNDGIAIRIDGGPPNCPIPVHDALAAPFYDVEIQRVPTSELRFRVPDTLAHPGGLDNSFREVEFVVRRKTGMVEVTGGTERRVGFYSSVGRKGRTRTVRVTFIDESGVKKTAVTQD